MSRENPLQVVSFATDLGWMALVGAGSTIRQAVFGYPTRAAALNALDPTLLARAQAADAWPSLVERLQEYASGGCVDFVDVPLDLDHLTPFQRRVVKHCRAIGYGQTRSYGALAAASGSQRAARAVGSTMAANRFPILVPCHRVINANGSIGNYSAPDGPRMKTRLLEMEHARLAPAERPRGSKKARRGELTFA
jgi:methylated-DNA-[protein]-cysteine S-methyltransferase